jgi:heavy metal translocating P-type ATPase
MRSMVAQPAVSKPPLPEEPSTPSPASSRTPHHLLAAGWKLAKSYPIPASALLLLLLSLILWAARHPALAQWPLILIIIGGGLPVIWELIQQLIHREFGVDLIAALAIVGSLILHEYLAGAIIVVMLSGGEALEAFALRRARSSLSALAERAPRIAHLRDGSTLCDIAATDVEVGMEVVVKPGELIPVDGIVTSGSSSVSEADLTGEPMPVRKEVGAPTLSGSVNLDGVLEVRAVRRSAESQYAQILRLMQEAQEHKAPIHRLADRYSVVFTIVTLAMASLAWLVTRNSVSALAVLVVATPCPLILATPIAIMSGISGAARQGLIVKSGAAVEQLGEVNVAVFDKTGTLTMGTPRVKTIVLADGSPYAAEKLLQYAASVEQLSSHILAQAVVAAARDQHLPLLLADQATEMFGKGVQATLAERAGEPGESQPVKVAVGNRTFLQQMAIEIPPGLLAERERRVADGEIVSFIAVQRQVCGLLVLADLPRPELSRLSADLKRAGITETILLTGDAEPVAQRIGAQAGVDRVIARCLPEDKVRAIQALLRERKQVLMVGDGVNDAPALATASVGIAVGVQGLTAASAAADAVLLSPDILRVVTVVRQGRWVMQVARQGIFAGMGMSGVAMIFAALGFIDPAVGAVLQEGIDVLVIVNALRAGRSPATG